MNLQTNAIDTVKTDVKEYQTKKDNIEIEIDFNEQISFIELISKNNIVAPIKLKVKYENADKENYDEKITREKKNELIEKLDLQIAYGKNLVNFYWNLINDKANKTKVVLYLNNNNTMKYLSEKCFDNNLRYCSISDLAYGNYAIKVVQYANEKELLETDYAKFSIIEETVNVKTNQVIHVNCNGGRPIVHN